MRTNNIDWDFFPLYPSILVFFRGRIRLSRENGEASYIVFFVVVVNMCGLSRKRHCAMCLMVSALSGTRCVLFCS